MTAATWLRTIETRLQREIAELRAELRASCVLEKAAIRWNDGVGRDVRDQSGPQSG